MYATKYNHRSVEQCFFPGQLAKCTNLKLKSTSYVVARKHFHIGALGTKLQKILLGNSSMLFEMIF